MRELNYIARLSVGFCQSKSALFRRLLKVHMAVLNKPLIQKLAFHDDYGSVHGQL